MGLFLHSCPIVISVMKVESLSSFPAKEGSLSIQILVEQLLKSGVGFSSPLTIPKAAYALKIPTNAQSSRYIACNLVRDWVLAFICEQ